MSTTLPVADPAMFDVPLPKPLRQTLTPHSGPPRCSILHAGSAGNSRDRFAVRFARDEALLVRMRREMPRGTWHPDLRIWSFSLTAEVCRRAREVFGETLVVDTELRDWYRAARAEELEAEQRKVERLARAERRREEQIRLDAERALYGDVSGPGMVSPGLPSEEDIASAATEEEREQLRLLAAGILVGTPPPRTPIAECSPVSHRFLADLPAKFADDWRTPLQEQGAAWLSSNGGGVLGDEVGLGKTRTTIMAAIDGDRALAGVHLVVAPLKPAQLTWPVEIRKFAPAAAVLEWPLGSSTSRAKAARAAAIDVAIRGGRGGFTRRPVFLVVNHDAIRTHLGLLEAVYASVIVDEAHEVLSTGNNGPKGSTKNAAGLRQLQVHPEVGMKVACTGTPFAGRLRNIWGQLDYLTPGRWGTKNEFAAAYTSTAGEVGSGVSLDRVADGREAAWGRLMSGWVLRRTRNADQRALIHDEVVSIEPLEGQAEQDRAWRGRESWNGAHRPSDEHDIHPDGRCMIRKDNHQVVPDVILTVTRRIQLCVGEMNGIDDASIAAGAQASYVGSSPKVDWIEHRLEEWGLLQPSWWAVPGNEKGKVIIASPWTSGLDLVEEMLARHLPSDGWVRIQGGMSMKRLDAAKQAFSAGRGPAVLLLSSTAGGAGLTLDEYCTRLILLSEHWIEDTQSQVIGRIANRTWEGPRHVYRLRTRGMLDAYLGARTEHQDTVQTSLLELAHA